MTYVNVNLFFLFPSHFSYSFVFIYIFVLCSPVIYNGFCTIVKDSWSQFLRSSLTNYYYSYRSHLFMTLHVVGRYLHVYQPLPAANYKHIKLLPQTWPTVQNFSAPSNARYINMARTYALLTCHTCPIFSK